MRIDVVVGKDGNVVLVTTLGKPSPEVAKFAAMVVGKEKYKAAVCDGAPFAMIFSYNMRFITRELAVAHVGVPRRAQPARLRQPHRCQV
ncbi:hypothetical protein [Massilia sp. TWR1-2-2]|uniref:hypothetical protein n=1 Tax=Massilia sp. TWR1-2-2 TaxID=2804584 RepID=UPI003CF92B3C